MSAVRRSSLIALLAAGCSKPYEPSDVIVPQVVPDTGVVGTDLLPPGRVQHDSFLKFEGDRPKNLLFLSIDTYRRDHLGTYGSDLTPFFDTITPQAMVMENHYQCSNWTYGSFACTLSGQTNPERGHIPQFTGPNGGPEPIRQGTPFLASYLRLLDFTTIIASANSLLSGSMGTAQGYDIEMQTYGNALEVGRQGYRALQGAIARDEVPGSWFLHIHVLDAHSPYDPADVWVEGTEDLDPWPRDLTQRDVQYQAGDNWPNLDPDDQVLLEAHLRALYEAEVREMDDAFRILWSELEAEGLLDDTLVVVFNDHGEQMFEHGFQTHAHLLHGEENDGILFFWADNIVPGRWTEPTSSLQLAPTLLEFYGAPHLPTQFSNQAIGKAPPDQPIFAEALARNGGQQMVVVGNMKLIYSWDGNVQLYDRSVDREEKNDLYDPTDPRALELWALLKPMVDLMAPLSVEGLYPTYPSDLP